MGHWGFSYVGFVFLLMLMVPNLIWASHKPVDYDNHGENKILLAFERVGQVCVTCTSLMFSDLNLHGWSIWNFWLIMASLLMVSYELWWVRYFKSEKSLKDFYSSFFAIPVAGATLPIAAFFCLGIYGRVIWLTASVVILGIGHIGIHLQHRKKIS